MAISKLGGTSKWVEIASNSPTSGTSVSFTGISEIYSDLAITFNKMGVAVDNRSFYLTFNNETSNGNYAYNYLTNVNDTYKLTSVRSQQNANLFFLGIIPLTGESSGFVVIENANSLFKRITGQFMTGAGIADYTMNIEGTWFDTSAINRIDCKIDAGANFDAGTIKIFGRV